MLCWRNRPNLGLFADALIARRLVVAVNLHDIDDLSNAPRKAINQSTPTTRFLPRRMTAIVASDVHDEARRLRVAAALLPTAERSAAGRLADASPMSSKMRRTIRMVSPRGITSLPGSRAPAEAGTCPNVRPRRCVDCGRDRDLP